MRKCLSAAIALTACLAPAPDGRASGAEQPRELGNVRWMRDLEQARTEARARGKPIFLLFQEIPGCSTCVRFGEGPLSHPLLVEAIEDVFVPVAIYNNRSGPDAEVLAQFREPAWNNPVARFLGPDGKELIQRRDGVWDVEGISGRMIDALRAMGREIPTYLAIAHDEARAGSARSAAFGMHCFWQGEAELGALEGVIATRVGWRGGREAVEVDYLPDRIGSGDLRAKAESFGCRVVEGDQASEAKASDHKFYLRKTPWRFVPMSALQASRANSDLARGRDPSRWMSPRQAALARRILQAGSDCTAGFSEPRSESLDAGTLHDGEFAASVARQVAACEEARATEGRSDTPR
jgi:hypothetical protein